MSKSLRGRRAGGDPGTDTHEAPRVSSRRTGHRKEDSFSGSIFDQVKALVAVERELRVTGHQSHMLDDRVGDDHMV